MLLFIVNCCGFYVVFPQSGSMYFGSLILGFFGFSIQWHAMTRCKNELIEEGCVHVCVWVCQGEVGVSIIATQVTEVFGSKLRPCMHISTPGTCVCVWELVDKDGSTSCAPDVDLTSLLAIPVLNKPHPWGGRQRTDWFHTLGLILHARLFEPARAHLFLGLSVILSLSLSLSLQHSHIHSLSVSFNVHLLFSHTRKTFSLLLTCFRSYKMKLT